jgi:hypothetical protein
MAWWERLLKVRSMRTLQAQKRMVAVGKQMMAKEKEDKARMREFMTAVRPPSSVPSLSLSSL